VAEYLVSETHNLWSHPAQDQNLDTLAHYIRCGSIIDDYFGYDDNILKNHPPDLSLTEELSDYLRQYGWEYEAVRDVLEGGEPLTEDIYILTVATEWCRKVTVTIDNRTVG
jgi:hypothetical protein